MLKGDRGKKIGKCEKWEVEKKMCKRRKKGNFLREEKGD
jgi:hypothetical protein